jgi:hypothetical protein
MTGNVAYVRAKRKSYWILVGKPERKRQLGRPRRRLETNIKISVREIE